MEVLRTMFEVDKLLVTNAVNRFTENTPLHLATEGGHLEAVKLMLLNGVAPNDENKFGLTPVHLGELLLNIFAPAPHKPRLHFSRQVWARRRV